MTFYEIELPSKIYCGFTLLAVKIATPGRNNWDEHQNHIKGGRDWNTQMISISAHLDDAGGINNKKSCEVNLSFVKCFVRTQFAENVVLCLE